MDDAYFRTFLEEQHAVLADFDAQIQAQAAQIATSPDAGRQSSSRLHAELLAQDRLLQTRFEDACRRLADVYMASDPGQRAAIRRSVENFRAVLACIGIPAEQIRTKIDGVRFQLALVYESIKDLRPDAEDAVLQLERLCRAAQAAGFDPNPHLREVADASSDAMRKLLLGNLVDQRGTIRCKRCNRRYKEDLPRCPFCGAANPRYIEPAHLDGSHGAPATAFEEDEGPWYYLPLLKALPFMLWSSGGCISLLVAVFLLAARCVRLGGGAGPVCIVGVMGSLGFRDCRVRAGPLDSPGRMGAALFQQERAVAGLVDAGAIAAEPADLAVAAGGDHCDCCGGLPVGPLRHSSLTLRVGSLPSPEA